MLDRDVVLAGYKLRNWSGVRNAVFQGILALGCEEFAKGGQKGSYVGCEDELCTSQCVKEWEILEQTAPGTCAAYRTGMLFLVPRTLAGSCSICKTE